MDGGLKITQSLCSNSLTTWEHRGISDNLVVVFSGVGPVQSETPKYEFARSASANGRHNVLFLSDPNRTWLNGSGLIEQIQVQIERFRDRCNAKRVIAVGHSMGGFSALIIPSFTKVDEVLAFAPQRSIDPRIVPDEHRWMQYRREIGQILIPKVDDFLISFPRYTVIHGRHGREAPQRESFPRPVNLRHYVLPHTHHNVPQRLKQAKGLDKVVGFAIDGRPRSMRRTLQNEFGAKLLPHQNSQPNKG